MKVLLVRSNPDLVQNSRLPASLRKEVGFVPPLGLAYIAAFLRESGIHVAILDAEVEELTLSEVRKRIFAFRPDIVGITSMTPTFHDDIAIASIAKEIGALVVFGGPQINAMPLETLQYRDIDFGIYGEGEFPMLRLCEALDGKVPIDKVPGLVFRDNNGFVIKNDAYLLPNLDEVPFPARDLLPNDRYQSIVVNGQLSTIVSSRGCPYHCGFCFKQPSDKQIRFRSASLVVDEIEEAVSKYEIEEFNFVSDTFTANNKFVETLCNELLSRDIRISWIAPTRADCVSLNLLKLMKRAGCRSLRFGVESGSPKILELMGKNLDLKKVLQAFQWAKEVNIETFAYLIIGYIHETEETVKETLNFVRVLKPDLVMYNVATPLPGTRLFEQAVAANLVEPDYWNKFVKDKNYPRIPYLFEHTDRWIYKGYRSFYFSPSHLFRKLLQLRPSNVRRYLSATKGILGLKKT